MPSRRSDSSAWADGLPFEQYLAEALRRLQRGELTPAEHEHLAPMFTMLGARLMSTCDDLNPKWSEALELIRRKPEDWFRGQPIDDRDRDLLNARPMPCFDLGKTSFLKKMVRPNTCCSDTNKGFGAQGKVLRLTSFPVSQGC